MKTEKPRLSLCVRFEHDYTFHASMKTIVTIEVWRGGGMAGQCDWYGITSSYGQSPIAGYEDLHFENFTFEDSEPNNGFQATLAYHNYRAELHDCERQVKTLRAIHKASQKITDREGYAKTFGQYVNRMARIVGAEVVRVEKTEKAWKTTGERYSECTLGDAVGWIDSRVNSWLQERKEAKTLQTA